MTRRRFLQSSTAAAIGALGVRSRIGAWSAILAPRSISDRAHLTIVGSERLGKINRNIYGHFAEHLGGCVYDGMWVGPDSGIPNQGGLRRDTFEALKRIHAPMIRWPGGCFADAYHWRDGIGSREKRPKTWNLWWDRDESNAFGTDEFLEYCNLCGAAPYICLNVGSGTVQEAADWMEYSNSGHATTVSQSRVANGRPTPYGVRYWAVGNESWGCGGNFDPEDYARHYARFVTYLQRMARGGDVEFIACGDTRGDWNQRFFETLLKRPNAGARIRSVQHLSIHHYFRDGPAVEFSDDDYYGLLGSVGVLERQLQKTLGVINNFTEPGGPSIGIALDEWGVWHPNERGGSDALLQPNTLRDAILAAVVLNGLNQLGARVSMANIAQTFNVLQCVAFTRGPEMVLTPTYYVFDLYQPHMDNVALKTVLDSPTFISKLSEAEVRRDVLSASASLDESGKKLCLTLVNQHLTQALEVEVELVDLNDFSVLSGSLRELTSPNVRDHNTFEKPHGVAPPSQRHVSLRGNNFIQSIPAHSVQTLVLDIT